MPADSLCDHRNKPVLSRDLFGNLGVEDAWRRLLPDSLDLPSGELMSLIISLDLDSRGAAIREVVVYFLDDGNLPRGEVIDVAEP